ncbi:YkvA family protein [Bacteroides sp.]|uniref:YkvA family protein n=1 Tax=Bacteroides sp. TaxID=29523 RepID=UPI0025895FEF|nr:DUF1232 domain-containing protein [Bacteroides sp.]
MSSYLLIIGALIYILSPIDLIPDIPPIGWLDDLFVILFVLMKLKEKGDNIINTISLILYCLLVLILALIFLTIVAITKLF